MPKKKEEGTPEKYDFSEIEAKWQKYWRAEKLAEPPLDKPKRPFYNLMMFPYPSAEGLHVGNMYAFTGSDIYGRFQRMRGYDVFEPMGLDGFGIHSENYALKIGAHPIEQAKKSETRFYKQLEAIGNGFAWDEHLETYDPEYYRWTQWLFTEMWRHGLAYRKKQAVNWCPKDKTVLSDEQAEGGKCERCGTEVIKKDLEQWFFRITKYAERLLENIEKLDWSDKVRIAQKNWIGRSEGAELHFEVRAGGRPNFVLLHGYKGGPDKNFFPWLKKELEKRGYDVQLPALPNPDAPDILAQIEHVKKNVRFDEYTVVVGHSLGSVVALKVLEDLPQPIKKLVLAAGFFERPSLRGKTRPYESTFDWKIDLKKVRSKTKEVVILRDASDRNIPPVEAERFKEKLGGQIVDFTANEPHICALEEPRVLEECLDTLTVFTTRPDTLFGATYMVVSPEHPLIDRLTSFIKNKEEVVEYRKQAAAKKEEERTAEDKEKTGVELKGIVAVNPATGEDIPVYAADYVLASYGTGAIMAVPAHDARDFAFATKYKLPIIKVVTGPSGDHEADHAPTAHELYEGDGVLVNSGTFSGHDSEKAKWDITEKVGGSRQTQYRLRDWLISRQRYWGPPIPMVRCSACEKAGKGEQVGMPGWYAVPEKELPIKLPVIDDFRPTGKDESPLASHKEFYETKCPGCGGPAVRETDVSDTFLDSAWYYLRYLNPENKKSALDAERVKTWLPVNMYIGGAEHSVLHLLYVRFVAMALHDWGYIHFEEPMTRFRAHGLLIKDGAKMSKSKGNVVNPDEYIKRFGADALRTYLMFLAPFEQGGDFRDSGILGITRFLERVWRFYHDTPPAFAEASAGRRAAADKDSQKKLERLTHRTIKKVTEDIENIHYNTTVSALMILLNEMENVRPPLAHAACHTLPLLLAPFAPHLTEEIWQTVLKKKTSVHRAAWPEYDPKLLEEETFTLVIQVNGKVRDTVEASAELSEEELRTLALAREKISALVGKHAPKNIVYVPKRLINIVI